MGCSRVVTNNGWKNHKFQAGQTGTVAAPDLYIACGISGAIQHWVGMMNAKHVLAVNTDRDDTPEASRLQSHPSAKLALLSTKLYTCLHLLSPAGSPHHSEQK